jgi:hypothetical protein
MVVPVLAVAGADGLAAAPVVAHPKLVTHLLDEDLREGLYGVLRGTSLRLHHTR